MEVGIGDVRVAAIGIDSGLAIGGLSGQGIADLVTIDIGGCGQLAGEAGVFVQVVAGIGSDGGVVDRVDSQIDGVGIGAAFAIVDGILEGIRAVELALGT